MPRYDLTIAIFDTIQYIVPSLVLLNINFALSKPLLGAAAALSRNLSNTPFASQLLQWNIKLLTMFIN